MLNQLHLRSVKNRRRRINPTNLVTGDTQDQIKNTLIRSESIQLQRHKILQDKYKHLTPNFTIGTSGISVKTSNYELFFPYSKIQTATELYGDNLQPEIFPGIVQSQKYDSDQMRELVELLKNDPTAFIDLLGLISDEDMDECVNDELLDRNFNFLLRSSLSWDPLQKCFTDGGIVFEENLCGDIGDIVPGNFLQLFLTTNDDGVIEYQVEIWSSDEGNRIAVDDGDREGYRFSIGDGSPMYIL